MDGGLPTTNHFPGEAAGGAVADIGTLYLTVAIDDVRYRWAMVPAQWPSFSVPQAQIKIASGSLSKRTG